MFQFKELVNINSRQRQEEKQNRQRLATKGKYIVHNQE